MPFGVEPRDGLRQQGAKRIDHDIAHPRFPERHKGLVPLVESRVGNGDYQRHNSPIPLPSVARATHTVKHGRTEKSEFGDVSQFADEDMRQVQFTRAQRRKEPVKDGNNYMAGLLRAEIVRGKERNNSPTQMAGIQ